MYYEESENNYKYSPNELAELSINNKSKYIEIVESKLVFDETVESWEDNNLKTVQKWLKK